ncbi:hypothetical protein [Cupriavidus basilensis]|uniref:hypothetical protein n=1 Tax=Cupriavidus basilensis TaxID=68895 RepID=UPI0007512879|nr:hypothetical protein [Cupriavidus basilensis]
MNSKGIQFEYDAEKECLLVKYPDKPMLRPYEIKNLTLKNMTFAEAAAFIGEKVLLMHPVYKEMFKDYLWSDDGTVPPAKP